MSKISASRIYILGVHQNYSLFYYMEEDIYTQPPKEYTPKKKIRLIERKTVKDIIECCPLVKDFYEVELSHDLKFLLATNFIYIKGGKQLFFDGIHEHIGKWESAWKTIKYNNYNNYKPQSCRRFRMMRLSTGLPFSRATTRL